MKPLPPPNDPWALQARVMDAVCNDLFDIASGRSKSATRFNAMREIRKQERGE